MHMSPVQQLGKVAFDGVVDWHMKHSFYQEMLKKSERLMWKDLV